MTELQNGKYKLVTQEKWGFGCTWVVIGRDDDYNETNCTIYTVDRSLIGDENYDHQTNDSRSESDRFNSTFQFS
ncbi:MAG: hypothetical protein ACKPCM_09945 [Pseudanabaena sp.]